MGSPNWCRADGDGVPLHSYIVRVPEPLWKRFVEVVDEEARLVARTIPLLMRRHVAEYDRRKRREAERERKVVARR
jgi:hypothetical protein